MPVMPARRPEAADAPARRAVQEVRRSEEAMVENVLGELKLYGVLEKERRGEERRSVTDQRHCRRSSERAGIEIWHLIGQRSPHNNGSMNRTFSIDIGALSLDD
jgi:hypothetical protein